MLIVPAEVVTGLLVNATSAMGRILAVSASGHSSRRVTADLDIARWLDTGRIAGNLPDLPPMPDEEVEKLAEILRGDDAQAVLQALLAARLTDAPESEVARIRAPWYVLFAAEPILPATLAETLFEFYDEQIGVLVARLEGTDVKPLPQIRNDAFATRVVNILGAIERQTAALSGRPSYRTEAAFLIGYRRHVVEEHGKLQPPDLDRRRKVPIADIYVDASVLLDSPPGAASDQDALNHFGFRVRELAGIIDRSVLLGDPGGGKTTAANVLMHQFANDPSGKIPFLVTLREYAAENPPRRFVAGYIEDTLESFYQSPPPPGLIDLLLLTGRAIVVFDGLDEFRPDDVTYLGIAAVVLTAVETRRFELSLSVEAIDVGPMGLLVSYLRYRQTVYNAKLPDLPVPEKFRQLFRDWADRKVRLTELTPPEAKDGK